MAKTYDANLQPSESTMYRGPLAKVQGPWSNVPLRILTVDRRYLAQPWSLPDPRLNAEEMSDGLPSVAPGSYVPKASFLAFIH